MPHLTLADGLPAVRGPLAPRPGTVTPLNRIAEVPPLEPASLSRGERGLITAYVSRLNATGFCARTHGAAPTARRDGAESPVTAVTPVAPITSVAPMSSVTSAASASASVTADAAPAPADPRLRALLRVAAEARRPGRAVSGEAVAAARALGARDADIRDTVLIASAFCPYARYVDCPAAGLPRDQGRHGEPAHQITGQGYGHYDQETPGRLAA
ncbi:alkylhydroperoxidase [Streptomyces jumonjinensis]|uniref:Alkylhydroperoxidase n=1 Tax=Streptomyces jumonjinensis TaxID=1945 RepID=A0A646KCK9_STRJU|nr:alkylhydroperoxidase [Streptomyces jumonjinensis]MQS99962.1 alkylhydroperoxidase [Streptomyces jumonjinensis]